MFKLDINYIFVRNYTKKGKYVRFAAIKFVKWRKYNFFNKKCLNNRC